MERKVYQICYGRQDTGWSAIHISPDLPKSILEDFLPVERGNAAAVSGGTVPMGQSETPSCMLEVYSKNDAAGLIRIQYQLSDIEGRPVSFAHGYLFPGAYELLKEPDALLRIRRENFADQRISPEEKEALRTSPGTLNRQLIEQSTLDRMPKEFALSGKHTLSGALDRCGMEESTYRTWMKVVYAQLLMSNTSKNLYVKTDGTEDYALNLLYLTYIALPYSLRPQLTASTYLHKDQRNTKLIFCAVPPEGAPQIAPASGENNILTPVTEKRLESRNPIIPASVSMVLEGSQEECFRDMEATLEIIGDIHLSGMQAINLAYSFFVREYLQTERCPVLFYNWLSLPGQNTEKWEMVAAALLEDIKNSQIHLSSDTRSLLASRQKSAVTESFSREAGAYLNELGESAG